MDIKYVYEKKRAFVRSLNGPLSVHEDFESIEYTYEPKIGDEYIRVKDKLGYVTYINVTANSEAAILKEVARLMLDERPVGLITSIERKRAIAPLFKGVA